MEENMVMDYEEKELHPMNGFAALFMDIFLFLLSIAGFIGCGFLFDGLFYVPAVLLLTAGILLLTASLICLGGFRLINPREALVVALFGKYAGTLKEEGFYWLNPFSSSINPAARSSVAAVATAVNSGIVNTASGSGSGKKISLKTMTLNNEKQKVNDVLGNPIIIGAIVIWRVVNPTKAVLNINNYKTYLSIQCDSTIRNIARLYPYDAPDEDSDEQSLRGSSIDIALRMKQELQERVTIAGLEIMEVRITHLSYSEEIAAAMLQRQQAVAIIAARQKIVEGAVSMVQMAINQLNENDVVHLDEERKAAMVSNLLVVLCGNRDAQPIVNSGSIY